MNSTIFEHWTDDDLEERLKNAEFSDPGMLEMVRAEIDRRATVKAEREKLDKLAADAKRKAQAAADAEQKAKKQQDRRQRMFTPSEMSREPGLRLSTQLATWAKVNYFYGGHAEAFIMDALAMAIRDGKTSDLVELFRDTKYAERWNMSHIEDPSVIVYFDEVFPAKKSKAA